MENNTTTVENVEAEIKSSSNNTNTVENVEAETKSSSNDTQDRANWSGKLEFLMSCISVSVGLGNIWRFPFTAYENGGGVFLIPYIVVLFLIGKPMYYMEVLIGQFSSKNAVKIWSICPSFFGIGLGQAYAGLAVLTYYSALIALTIYYLVASFQAVLPWSYCREEWGSNCVDALPQEKAIDDDRLQSSSELYFVKTVLREFEDISEGIGLPSWRLTLTLFATWVITFGVIIKGIKSLGKASYFLALFPYVVLITLLVRAVSLEGAADGIIFFLKPKWEELLNVKVWKEAVVQCFFSLNVSFGPIITFSSYNRFDHNVYRDAMIVTTLDTFTSLLAGITIFGVLGNLAFNLNSNSIDEVVKSGTGLAFISYPDAIAKFKSVPQLFSVLFFIMLFVLGVGSLSALQSSIATIICDQFKVKKFWKVSLGMCIFGFALGIMYVTPGGQWILNLVDYYAVTFVVFFLGIFEVIGIIWIYGVQNFCDDVEFMTKRKVSIYWRLCWIFFTPVLLIIIFIYTLVTIEPISYAGAEYPLSANIAGWIVLAIGFAQFPLWAIWYLTKHRESNFVKTIKKGTTANSKWGPNNPEQRVKWLLYKQQVKEQRLKERESKGLSEFLQKVYFIFGISK